LTDVPLARLQSELFARFRNGTIESRLCAILVSEDDLIEQTFKSIMTLL
jgi:hypothetical protein